MATTAHCMFCFETLAASLEDRKALSLEEVERLWAQYDDTLEQQEEQKVGDQLENELGSGGTLRSPAVSRVQNESPAGSSSSSTPSSELSASSSSTGLNASTSSSKTSLASSNTVGALEEKYPVYVTWNTLSARGNKHLRGCIGTFDPQPISEGLREYSLISAFQDHRFNQISLRELPTLSNAITLLMNFTPCKDVMDWDIGKHGIKIRFSYKSRSYGATYLPDVAAEQGWTKEETLVSLMRKAGWSGKEKDWKNIDVNVVRYEGMKASADYAEFKAWRDWLKKEALA